MAGRTALTMEGSGSEISADPLAAGTALGESEDRYRALFDFASNGFCIIEVLLGEQGQPVDSETFFARLLPAAG